MPPLIEINIFKDGQKPHKRKHLYISLNGLLIHTIMDLTLQQDKGAVVAHLVVKDQFGADFPVSGSSYQSSDENVFTVSGSDSGFTITPVNPGTATFTYSASGLTGTGIVTVTQATAVATSIDFVIDQPQP